MTQMPGSTAKGDMRMQEGDDFVCGYCGCEIRLRRHGDPEKMQRGTFTCCCGTRMDRESRSGA